MKKFGLSLFVGLLLRASVTAASAAQTDGIAPALQEVLQSAAPDSGLPIIVTLSSKADLSVITDRDKRVRRSRIAFALHRHATQTQPPLRAFLQSRGASNITSLWIINGMAATVAAKAIPELAAQPGVESVRLDETFSAPALTAGSATTAEWNLNAITAPTLWSWGYPGQGVVVANMDTGVDADHPDLSGKWRGGTNSWFDPNGQHGTPFDSSGHGTQTMGIMVGGNAGGTSIGVAPGAQWIGVKIFDDAQQSTYSKVHQGFQWLLDPDGNPLTNDAPDVVNNSWSLIGANVCNLEFQTDIQVLKAAEIAVVFAAGNEGPSPSSSVSPANNPGSSAAGSVDASLAVASDSSRGPSACDGTVFPEVAAPGVNIRTADLSYGGFAFYKVVSGTSIAAPHVSGAMGLLLNAFPSARVSAVEAALKDAAQDLGPAGVDNDYGYGLIKVDQAHSLLLQRAQSPIAASDAYFVDEDVSLAVGAPGVLANDSDSQNSPLTASLASNVSHGVLALHGDGSFSYMPNLNYNGDDAFTYVANNGVVDSNLATVNITVNPVNDPPVAADDSASTKKNTSVTVNVLANDSDPDGNINPSTVTVTTSPNKGGTVTVNPINGSVAFKPKSNFRGTDTFRYNVKDTMGVLSNQATVWVTIK